MSTSPSDLNAQSNMEAQSVTRPLRPGETPQSVARQGYDSSAESYLAWTSSHTDLRVRFLEKLFTRYQNDTAVQLTDARALDLGCGAGTPATLVLARNVAHITGVEISSAQIALAQSKFADARISEEKYTFIESDMMSVVFPDGSFDIITAFYSIIHLGLADQREILRRMCGWLKPRGHLLFNAATKASEAGGSVTEGWLGMKSAFWASFGEGGMLDVVREVGFEDVEYERSNVEGDAEFTWIWARRGTGRNSEL